ncbi:hypothetical protein G5S34_17240 [Herbaspirillum frisingense]|uniref:hypothetical protein n=1 Tax=Herbaspirillum frisingense TaxID=92645 RepID=UPI001601AE4D|nr:hypothetical protein [Herbaspirillum frisingense]QNB08325.1 hypothetical protein G5S34_17240 [Herbaspirillum frisingense]
MSYAVRKDGKGWRAVSDESECTDDELWQEDQPAVPEPTAQPELDPIDKLKNFLAANPDVAALISK